MNSHDLAAQLDNHLNNSIVIQEEAGQNQNEAPQNQHVENHENLAIPENNVAVIEENNEIQENGDQGNLEFNFDSDNEAYVNSISEYLEEGEVILFFCLNHRTF